MFFLYEISNWCVNLAGLLILQRRGISRKQLHDEEVLLVSRDLEFLLFFGQLARTYWGVSPPEIWLHDETNWTKWLVICDFVVSIALWSAILVSGFVYGGNSKTRVVWYLRWPVLMALAMALAVPGSWFVQMDGRRSFGGQMDGRASPSNSWIG